VIKNWKLWLSLAISAVALYFTFRDIRFEDIATALQNANVLWILPAAGVLIVTLCLRAWRWAVLMGGALFGITFHALNIGYMLNSILPFRLGEIGRAYVIGERTPIRMARALSSVVVERMMDLAAVVLLFALFAQFIPMPPDFSRAALVGAAVVVVLVAAFAIMIWQSVRVEAGLALLARRFPWLGADMLVRRFHDIRDGFAVIRSSRALLTTLAVTAGIWLSQLALAYLSLMAFVPARLDEAGLVLVASNLGGALPSAPGGLGVVQFFATQSLVIPFHVPVGAAVAFAFTWSLFQQLFLIVLGMIGLVRVGMSFGSVSTQKSVVS
jgi:glycosyltransferase 2 family protein